MALDLPLLRPMTTPQREALAETARLHAALGAARRRRAGTAGTLAWRPVRGVEHLVLDGPSSADDRRARTRVLGPRSPATEAQMARLLAERAEAAAAERDAEARVAHQAGANRAAGLGTVPTVAARALRGATAAGARLRAAGAAALVGHLALAGRTLAPAGPALVDPAAPLGERLALVGTGLDAHGLCRAMRAAGEPGFAARSARLAVGPGGYVVELLPAEGDLAALARGPGVPALAVDLDGMPVPMLLPPLGAYVAERLRRGRDADAEGVLALAQARAASAAAPAPGAPRAS